ncbi:MAG: hypothetical protein NT091_03930, partial [Candidatus Falkowbacteria bacterium]|nr:hypothetical protein [Candidatus Falkowbacteria bacterium]
KLSSRKARIIVTEGKGGDSIIKIFDNTGRLINSFNAYANNSKEGIDLASGDVSGDGFDEIIVGAGLGSEPLVRYFDYDGKLLGSFLAYNKNLKNGVNVASITINNN